jgi:hypothetical protein
MTRAAATVEESRQILDDVTALLEHSQQLRDESVLINKFANAVGRLVDDLLRRQAENPSLNPSSHRRNETAAPDSA